MTDLAIADHAATFTTHPLEGSSRFMLLGMLAELSGLTLGVGVDRTTDEQQRIAREFPPGVVEAFEAVRNMQHDDRDAANAILGERVVDAMFGDGPVHVTVSEGPASTATKAT